MGKLSSVPVLVRASTTWALSRTGWTPPETLPRSPGHYAEWIQACKGEGPPPGSNFQYSGWVTESNHLGNVAYRTGKQLEWDVAGLRAMNAPEADQFIRRPYRQGWDGIIS